MESILFFLFSAVAVVGGILTISRRNPLSCAISLVVTFLAVAGLYSLLTAPFVAVMQVLVYAGAIMVLVIFVIMLLNLPEKAYEEERISKGRLALGVVLGLPLIGILFSTIGQFDKEPVSGIPADYGTVKAVGELMFTRYLYPFEIVSVLILAAIIGAVILAKRHLD